MTSSDGLDAAANQPPAEWVVGHCDTAPWNIVGRDGSPQAFVDWEFAGQVERITELAYTA